MKTRDKVLVRGWVLKKKKYNKCVEDIDRSICIEQNKSFLFADNPYYKYVRVKVVVE